MSIADVLIYVILGNFKAGHLDGIPTSICDAGALLTKCYDQVKEHPMVAKWEARAL